MGRLSGKRAVVTGAGSGIGRATARLFAAEGAQVLAVDKNEEQVQGTAALIQSEGHRAIGFTADVADEDSVKDYVAHALEAFGGLDVIYANAGVHWWASAPCSNKTVDMWEEILRVNLIGVFLAVKWAGKHMVSQGHGSIICTASVAALRANAGGCPYACK